MLTSFYEVEKTQLPLYRFHSVQKYIKKYLRGIRKGKESRKVQNFNLMTPYSSGVIDNNLGSSWDKKVNKEIKI